MPQFCFIYTQAGPGIKYRIQKQTKLELATSRSLIVHWHLTINQVYNRMT